MLIAAAAALAKGALAQTHWQLRGAPAAVRVVGASAFVLQGPVAWREAGSGEHAVHFAPDANGKPMSLQFAVPDGARVALATESASPAVANEQVLVGEHWHEHAGDWSTRTTGEPERADYRVVASVRLDDAALQFGLVARWRAADQLYRFVCDRAARELRLERQLGGPAMTLLRAPLPAWAAGEEHELALQVQGFRLQAFVDDVPVLQCFDGALTQGAFGLCHRGPTPAWQRCAIAPPVAPSASSAVMQDGRSVALFARAPVTPGHWYVLELALDRPFAALPILNGLEPWLLQRPAAPQILLGDWRGTLGRGVTGELGNAGAIAVTIELPALSALRSCTVLARWLLVSADGGEIAARTPSVPIRF